MDILLDKTVIFFIANTLYVISYMLTSMLWLRLLAVIAAASTFPYFYFQEVPLWSALFWQTCFLLVNGVNLVILLYRMRTPRFDEFEARAHELKFADLKPHEAAQLFRRARRLALADGEALLQDGEVNESLFLIVEGACRVLKDGHAVARLEAGEFAGELSYVSGEAISADVVADGAVEIMCWDRATLDALFKRQGLYQSYLNSLCSVDIAHKLRHMTSASGGLA
jgi:CRP-like cAMP-binding protein